MKGTVFLIRFLSSYRLRNGSDPPRDNVVTDTGVATPKKKSKKRKKQEGDAVTDAEGRPKKKKKKKKRRRRKPRRTGRESGSIFCWRTRGELACGFATEWEKARAAASSDSVNLGGSESGNPSHVPESEDPRSSSAKKPVVDFTHVVKFDYEGNTPLAYNDEESTKLVCQIRGEPGQHELCDREVRYGASPGPCQDSGEEFNIKELDSRQREEFKRLVNERDEAVAQEEALKEKCENMMEELKSSTEAVKRLEGEVAKLEREKAILEGKIAEIEVCGQRYTCEDCDLIDSETATALRTPSGSHDETPDDEPEETMPSTEPLVTAEVPRAGLETSIPSHSLPRDGVLEISDLSITYPNETEASDVALESQREEEVGEEIRSSGDQVQGLNVDPPLPATLPADSPRESDELADE
ncbi:hypothetical protein Bca52824_001278 [Brassica carinata]|uniref:Uncharacterized protein n=1 Tax=Brassica carinata TaxID=52824 RepID=A0A8X8BD72_BRACI|nr:hypothetical protein Bca52824_001278 [Brassica carinata]